MPTETFNYEDVGGGLYQFIYYNDAYSAPTRYYLGNYQDGGWSWEASGDPSEVSAHLETPDLYETLCGIAIVPPSGATIYKFFGFNGGTVSSYGLNTIIDATTSATVDVGNYIVNPIPYPPQTQPLATPTGLNAAQITSNSATIGWNAVENASSYQITYTPSGGTTITVTRSTNSVVITNLLNFTSYSVEVVAVGDGTTYSDSDPSSALTFTTLNQLATPTIDVSAEDDFGVVIQQIAGATTYHLQYRAQDTTAWTDITSTSNDIELPSSIPTGVVYEFRAYVSDSTGVALDSDFSDILTEKLFSTLTYKSIKTRTSSYIQFNVAYLVSGRYVSEYKPRSSSEWTFISSQTLNAAPSGNNVVVTSTRGLYPSTVYDFRVRLMRDDGLSRWLNVSQVTKDFVSAPPAPTCTVDGTTVYVQITPLEGYSWYQVVAYVNNVNETGAVRLPWTQATNQTVTELYASTYYTIRVQYRVTAENDAYENDSFRSMTQVLTGAPQLETPTGLESSNITSTSARIGWNAVENASGYKVEYRQSAGGGQTYPWIEASD